MDIVQEKKSTTEGVIKITLKESDYQPKVEEKIKDYSRKAAIKGFRPGKVPKSLIQKMYGKSILVDEVNHLLSHSLQDYIKEQNLQILGEPIPDEDSMKGIDWETQKDFEFIYHIGVAEEFEVKVTKKNKVNAYQIKVDDKEVKNTIKNIRQQYGKMINPPQSEAGDSVFGELKQGELVNKTLVEIDRVEKKFQKLFLGKKNGELIKFDIRKSFKDDELISVLTGKEPSEASEIKGEFEFEVININRSEPAALEPELFDRVFGPGAVKTEKDFGEKVSQSISSNYDRETEALLTRDIQKKLIDETKINLPEKFLKKWLLLSNQEKLTEEEVDKEFPAYSREIKWSLIKNKIGKENDIKVEHEEVIETTKNMIRTQFGQGGLSMELEENLDSFADNYLKAEGGDNYMKVYNQVQAEKIFTFIKENLTINQKKVSLDEFKKIALN